MGKSRKKTRKHLKLEMPPPIPGMPKAVLNTPQKKDGDWRYLSKEMGR